MVLGLLPQELPSLVILLLQVVLAAGMIMALAVVNPLLHQAVIYIILLIQLMVVNLLQEDVAADGLIMVHALVNNLHHKVAIMSQPQAAGAGGILIQLPALAARAPHLLVVPLLVLVRQDHTG